jgi:adenosylcobyric acid synthase
VRPFKPQNMSNNAAVTADGGEIGRAQALQARAARIAPSVHMNPVLLKPQSEIGAQIIVRGRVRGSAKAAAYQKMKPELLPAVLESFAKMRAEADLVLVEGAGSASEINLRANDIANMGFARAADVPVVLVGDIDRGGVIASLVGTSAVIDAADAALIRGFIVNKFRGDPALFADAMTFIAEKTGWDALGLVPFFPDARLLPAEDALALEHAPARKPNARLRPGAALPADTDLVILPGSKATVADLAALRGAGFDVDIAAHVRRGGAVLGLCGGYQMLGRRIGDPDGVEGPAGTVAGLGLLDVETVLTGDKRLEPAHGEALSAPFRGYEMHMGVTTGPDCARPFATLADGAADGAVSADGRIAGTYVHGLFADDRQRTAWLTRLGAGPSAVAHDALVETTLDRLAAHVAAHLDLDRLLKLAR